MCELDNFLLRLTWNCKIRTINLSLESLLYIYWNVYLFLYSVNHLQRLLYLQKYTQIRVKPYRLLLKMLRIAFIMLYLSTTTLKVILLILILIRNAFVTCITTMLSHSITYILQYCFAVYSILIIHNITWNLPREADEIYDSSNSSRTRLEFLGTWV
jgi:hypothetical protein